MTLHQLVGLLKFVLELANRVELFLAGAFDPTQLHQADVCTGGRFTAIFTERVVSGLMLEWTACLFGFDQGIDRGVMGLWLTKWLISSLAVTAYL